ncbi:MAG: hypothetical protein M1829_005758 [Trizodia sp. TS-e1964]|nr:MAG: hypothetical protein M1829_005758 [Trizodia sp. TS-e1964]
MQLSPLIFSALLLGLAAASPAHKERHRAAKKVESPDCNSVTVCASTYEETHTLSTISGITAKPADWGCQCAQAKKSTNRRAVVERSSCEGGTLLEVTTLTHRCHAD